MFPFVLHARDSSCTVTLMTRTQFLEANLPAMLRMIDEAKVSDSSSYDMAIVQELARFIPDHITD